MSDFALSAYTWTLKVDNAIVQILKDAVLELCTRIIDDTPIDMRRPDEIVARGDWNSAVGEEPGDVERNDPTGIRALDGVKAVLSAWNPKEGDTFYFANYKPYILRLEYERWSNQSPSGMMGIHVITWDSIVKEAARKYGSA